MEETTDLLFVLASSDRMRLLLEIQGQDLRLTQLAKKLSATVQETTRHLSRLRDAKLIEKHSDASYRLTAYGRQVLCLLPSFEFLFRNREYFLSHELSYLPPAFIQRIGELSDCQFIEHVGDGIAYADWLEREAEQYIWFMFDQCPDTSFNVGHPEKVSVRALGSRMRPELYQYCSASFRDRFEFRFRKDVSISIVMNESSAMVCFPNLDGKVDYSYGFSGSNDFHKWCYDLYNFYWDRSKKALPGQPHFVEESTRVVLTGLGTPKI